MTPQILVLTKPQSPSFFKKETLFKFAVLFAILTSLWVFRAPLQDLLSLIKDRDALTSYLNGYGNLGVLLLFFILFVQVIVAAIPGHPFIVAGGYLYGFTTGFLITHLSTVLASQLAYFLARQYGRPIVEKFTSGEVVDHWTKKAERQGVVFFIISFILPIFPTDVMNFVAGLSGLSPRKFFAANLIGRLPASISLTLLGSHGLGLSPYVIPFAVVLTAAILIGWQILGRKLEQKFTGATS